MFPVVLLKRSTPRDLETISEELELKASVTFLCQNTGNPGLFIIYFHIFSKINAILQ